MPAIAAIVLKDGQATPVDHTFSPVRVDATSVAKYADRSGGIAIGYPILTMQVRDPVGNNSKSRVYKVTLKVWAPVLEATAPSTATGIQPAPMVAYTQSCTVEFLLPERSTRLNRQDILAYAKNLLAHPVVAAAVADLEPVYG